MGCQVARFYPLGTPDITLHCSGCTYECDPCISATGIPPTSSAHWAWSISQPPPPRHASPAAQPTLTALGGRPHRPPPLRQRQSRTAGARPGPHPPSVAPPGGSAGAAPGARSRGPRAPAPLPPFPQAPSPPPVWPTPRTSTCDALLPPPPPPSAPLHRGIGLPPSRPPRRPFLGRLRRRRAPHARRLPNDTHRTSLLGLGSRLAPSVPPPTHPAAPPPPRWRAGRARGVTPAAGAPSARDALVRSLRCRVAAPRAARSAACAPPDPAPHPRPPPRPPPRDAHGRRTHSLCGARGGRSGLSRLPPPTPCRHASFCGGRGGGARGAGRRTSLPARLLPVVHVCTRVSRVVRPVGAPAVVCGRRRLGGWRGWPELLLAPRARQDGRGGRAGARTPVFGVRPAARACGRRLGSHPSRAWRGASNLVPDRVRPWSVRPLPSFVRVPGAGCHLLPNAVPLCAGQPAATSVLANSVSCLVCRCLTGIPPVSCLPPISHAPRHEQWQDT